ncbi:MAG TPA: carbon-nitrogen hydrolase family protein [Steroidobacteraceae bacterium]|nr:carbon-nitrogen hydrolase family protein [Steroidobacteraceae bacterium]
MKVATLQMNSGPDVTANLAVAGGLLAAAAAAGAVLAVLPENFAIMGAREADRLAVAEPAGAGPIQDAIAELAQKLSLWVVAGTLPIRGRQAGRIAPASVVFDANGKQVARYDKMHLFDVDIPEKGEIYRESATFEAGTEPILVETPVGLLGLSVCYDLRFPELFRQLSARGAQLLTVPAAFTVPTGQAHWELLLRARAVENLCYVLAAAQWGMHANGRETYGDAMIVDYWGRVLARRSSGAGVVVAEIDTGAQADVRAGFPALKHRML